MLSVYFWPLVFEPLHLAVHRMSLKTLSQGVPLVYRIKKSADSSTFCLSSVSFSFLKQLYRSRQRVEKTLAFYYISTNRPILGIAVSMPGSIGIILGRPRAICERLWGISGGSLAVPGESVWCRRYRGPRGCTWKCLGKVQAFIVRVHTCSRPFLKSLNNNRFLYFQEWESIRGSLGMFLDVYIEVLSFLGGTWGIPRGTWALSGRPWG